MVSCHFSYHFMFSFLLVSLLIKIAAAETSVEHVIVLVGNGMAAPLETDFVPNTKDFLKLGGYSNKAYTVKPPEDAETLASLLTSCEPKDHHVSDNNLVKNYSNTACPTIFQSIKQKGLESALFTQYKKLPDYFIEENVVNSRTYGMNETRKMTEEVIELLKSDKVPNLIIVEYEEVDIVAHEYGFFSKEFFNAIASVDTEFGLIYDTVKSTNLLNSSFVVVCSTHGGNKDAKKHEDDELITIQIFWGAVGNSINQVKKQLKEKISILDTAALIADRLDSLRGSAWAGNVPQFDNKTPKAMIISVVVVVILILIAVSVCIYIKYCKPKCVKVDIEMPLNSTEHVDDPMRPMDKHIEVKEPGINDELIAERP